MTRVRAQRSSVVAVVLVCTSGLICLRGQENSFNESAHAESGRLLFTTETFGGNGRTCLTCHSLQTGTVSPADALRRHPRDPLFLADGSDDGQGGGIKRMLEESTVLIKIPLPPNGDFVFNRLPPPFAFILTKQDRADIVAYLKLLE